MPKGKGMSNRCANSLYLLILVFAAVLALVLQHWGAPTFDIYSFNVGCDQVPHLSQGACKGDGAVYRISFGLFLFFVFNIFGTLFGKRSFHVGWWVLKALLFAILVAGAFFVPNDVFGAGVGADGTQVAGSWGYAQFSRVVSAFFLISQIVAFIDFAYHWNDSWLKNAFGGEENEGQEATNKNWLYGLVAVSALNLILSITGIVVLYLFYGACAISSFFITLTAIAVVGMSVESGTDSDSSLLTSSIVSLYSVYLCWSAVNSNPNTLCNPTASGSSDPEMIALSMAVAAFSLGWTCYSATASATTATSGPKASSQAAKADAEDELKKPLNAPTSNKLRSTSEDDREHKVKSSLEDPDDVDEMDEDDMDDALPGSAGGAQPDSRLWFFHIVMAAGALYMAMLLTNWGTGSLPSVVNGTGTGSLAPSGSGTAVYVSNSTGKAQMWVKIASQWVAIALYSWTVVAPRCFPDRDFN